MDNKYALKISKLSTNGPCPYRYSKVTNRRIVENEGNMDAIFCLLGEKNCRLYIHSEL